MVVGRGGQGDYAWEVLARKGSGQDYWIETRHQNGDLFMGESFGSRPRPPSRRPTSTARRHGSGRRPRWLMGVATGGGGQGRGRRWRASPRWRSQTFRKKGFPFAFWVVAPLPPEARPRSFTGFDAAGQQIAKGTDFAGYADGCR